MKTRLKLNPGQKGTKALVDIYGDTLVCVRYRYDEETRTRIKTAEIIVEKTDWTPPSKFADDTLVPVEIAYTEDMLKSLAKSAGGRWNPEKRVWFIVYGRVKGTELEKHIVLDANLADVITAKSDQSI